MIIKRLKLWVGCIGCVCLGGVQAQDPEPSMSQEYQWVGQVVPRKWVTLMSPTDGHIQEVMVSPGQRVGKGTVLLRLKNPTLAQQLSEYTLEKLNHQAQLAQLEHWDSSEEMLMAQKGLLMAQSRFKYTQQRAIDSKALFEKGIISRQEWQWDQSACEQSQHAVLNAQLVYKRTQKKAAPLALQAEKLRLQKTQHHIEQIKQEIEASQLRAPFDGVVFMPQKLQNEVPGARQMSLSCGQEVHKGQILFALADIETLSILVYVDEVEVGRLSPKHPVHIQLLADPKWTLKGTITTIDEFPSQEKSGKGISKYAMTVALDHIPDSLKAQFRVGVRARVVAKVKRPVKGLIVPKTSVHYDAKQAWIETQDSQCSVVLGQSNASHIEVFPHD